MTFALGPGIRRDEQLEGMVSAILHHRLLQNAPQPIAVALSGGGDSLALTLVADDWSRAAGRELLILTVDHRLNPASAGWTAACAAVAARLGRPFRALTWTGAKPARGLPAAARNARHRLLADAARDAGASVILMGHTADDRAEAAAMRAAESTTPDPAEWAPSPAWPEGRGLFLLRPLLDVRRADLRGWLADRGETWIDDPANVDPRFARSRARAAGAELTPRVEPTPLALAAEAIEAYGTITLGRATLRAASSNDARRFVGLAAVCAGGGDRRPAGDRIARLAEALRREGPVVATLAGARFEADRDGVRVFREAGEARRGGLAEVERAPHAPVVWDGRFEIAPGPGRVRRLAGLAERLPAADRAVARTQPAAARGALPTLAFGDGISLAPVRSLVGERLRAAAGLVSGEGAIPRA